MRHKTTFQRYLIFTTSVLLLCACNPSNRWEVDVSAIDSHVRIERFDKNFDAIRVTKPLDPQLTALKHQYGAFYADYVEQIINAGSLTDTSYYANIRKIIQGKPYQQVRDQVFKTYPNLDKQTQALNDAFKHVKYYYPNSHLPRVIAYLSGFEVQVPIGEGYIGIGLDMFLGANNSYYKALTAQIPQYISRKFTPDNIVPRLVEAIAREEFYPERDQDRTLLSKMVYHGKILVFLDAMMPTCPDTLKIGYTAAQLHWCQQHESEIWGYFISSNLLFESDLLKFEKYLNEAPFTPGLGERNESAPKLARWIGWQIVRKYGQQHPEITLPQLMQTVDAQKILTEATYKPK